MRPRVLCVEDHADTCELIALLLDEYEVVSVHTLEEARAKLATHSFALFILDSWLPDGRGIELCRAIRLKDKQTPIVFYSGAAFPIDKEVANECGANAYIVKPGYPDELVRTVTELIRPELARLQA